MTPEEIAYSFTERHLIDDLVKEINLYASSMCKRQVVIIADREYPLKEIIDMEGKNFLKGVYLDRRQKILSSPLATEEVSNG